jgi:hypothetical protein
MPLASFLKIGAIIFLFSVAVVSCRSKGEQVKTEVAPSDSLANYPYWIEMMDNFKTCNLQTRQVINFGAKSV